ncbi:MAG: tetratricopeptide repeat protein [Granulosicoccaceae bacterium]|jgi:Tfp pilus assembly protein PilF
MSTIDNFENMLAAGHDNALLRFSLGNEYLKREDFVRAMIHLEAAVEQNPDYSAAWKLFGKALSGSGEVEAAITAYTRGIEVAERAGDKQAAKEMQVFIKRLFKARDQGT